MSLIYYVEDDQAIRYIIEKTIKNAQLEGVGFSTGEAFLHEFSKKKPNLILLDVMLPDFSGLDLIVQIRKKDSEVPIIMISALQSEMDKVKALDLGADDYITKPFGILELTARMTSKLRKRQTASQFYLENLMLDDQKHLVTVNEEAIYLTNKEYDILKLLLANQEKVVSKEAIFLNVWETDFIGETRTLDMHIKALREKLRLAKAKATIQTIRGVGYQIQ